LILKIYSLNNLDVNNKVDFLYTKNLKLNNNISFSGGKKLKNYFNLGPLDSPNFIINLNSFISSLVEHQYYAVLFKVPTIEGGFISTHKQIILDKSIDPELIKSRLIYKMEYHESFYDISTNSTVIAEYFPIYVNIEKPKAKINNIPLSIIKKVGLNSKFFSNKYCPLSMDLSKYGVLHSSKLSIRNTLIKIYLFNELKFIVEELNSSSRNVQIYNNKDNKVFEFNDENFGDFLLDK